MGEYSLNISSQGLCGWEESREVKSSNLRGKNCKYEGKAAEELLGRETSVMNLTGLMDESSVTAEEGEKHGWSVIKRERGMQAVTKRHQQ